MVTTRKRSNVTPSPPGEHSSRRYVNQTIQNVELAVVSTGMSIKEKIKMVLLALFRRMKNGIWFRVTEEENKIDDIFTATGLQYDYLSKCMLYYG